MRNKVFRAQTGLSNLRQRIGDRTDVAERFIGDLGESENAGENIVEVVRNATGDRANAFHFLRLMKLHLELAVLGLFLSCFGDVANDDV